MPAMENISSFFPYTCDGCGVAMCERMPLFSLAQGFEEEAYCASCLSQHLGIPVERWLPKTKRYIHSRDCFKKPWNAIDISACPLQHACLCTNDEATIS